MSSGSLFLIISSLLASSSTRADAFAFSPPLTTTTTTSISIPNNDNRPNYYCHLRKATPLNLFPFMKGKGGNAHNQDNNNSNDDDHSKQPQNNKKYSPLEDEPWKNDDSYWDMLQKASKDPETFEKFIEESVAKKKLGHATSLVSSSSSSATAELGTASSEGGESSTSSPKKRGTYQRIEEWDAQRKNGDGNGMSEEERLQWECQKMGNQFRQNEILRHHLNSF